MPKKTFLLLAIVLLVASLSLPAQDEPTPADNPPNAPAEPVPVPEKPAATAENPEKSVSDVLEVTIDAIEGEAEVCPFQEKDWVAAVKGMKLTEGAKISTGFKSQVVLLFADNSTVVVKSLTQLTVSRFIKEGDKVTTDLKIRVGAVRVKVTENQPAKTDMKISTPNATASVRGTEIEEVKASRHFGDSIAIDSGKVEFRNKERAITVKGGESTNQNLTNPIENAVLKTVAEITPAGVTPEEQQALVDISSLDSLIGDVNSSTSNPPLERVLFQEKPTQEQLEEKEPPEEPEYIPPS